MRPGDPGACQSLRDRLEKDTRDFGVDSDLHSWSGDGFLMHAPVHKVSLNVDFQLSGASVQLVYFKLVTNRFWECYTACLFGPTWFTVTSSPVDAPLALLGWPWSIIDRTL